MGKTYIKNMTTMKTLVQFVKSLAMIVLGIWRWLSWNCYIPIKTRFLTVLWRVKCGKNVRFLGQTIIRAYEQNSIEIGDDVFFNSCVSRNFVGLTGPTILIALSGARIKIGARSGFSSVVMNARKGITIGENVNVGGNVRIFDNDFHPLDYFDRRKPEQGDRIRSECVCIEDDCFIGTNAILLKGTHVGARSIIAAGSVVFGLDIPPDSIVKGSQE